MQSALRSEAEGGGELRKIFTTILQKSNLYFRIFLTQSVILYMYTAGTECIK